MVFVVVVMVVVVVVVLQKRDVETQTYITIAQSYVCVVAVGAVICAEAAWTLRPGIRRTGSWRMSIKRWSEQFNDTESVVLKRNLCRPSWTMTRQHCS